MHPQCWRRVKNDNPSKENITKGEHTIVVVVSQVNLVTSVSKWMVDFGPTRHTCPNKRKIFLDKCEGWRITSLST